ncbi:hypothetical protein Patl1_25878 [Pistacia atlantica]|uniref:Uncharacterized protein n=1 Tax=Pistacia atlantica TaxID=434234 RepID=A0ACC1B0F3_9ROSI|nr:hypothetical protein Patl1_25878 [Pistacia atlantica]
MANEIADGHSSHQIGIEIRMANETSHPSFTEDYDYRLSNRILGKLEDVTSKSHNRYIFKVPERQRNVNDKAYEPYIVAIGPYHRGKKHLMGMEEHKKGYLKELLDRRPKNEVISYVKTLRSLEKEARDCYEDDFANITTDEFVEMMLLDGCFIVELLRRCVGLVTGQRDGANDPERESLISLGWMTKKLGCDFLLVENQLPFFVLQELFNRTSEEREQEYNFQDMILYFFAFSVLPNGWPVSKKWEENSTESINHLLSLLHDNWLLCCHPKRGIKPDANEIYWRFMHWVNAKNRREPRTNENWWFKRWCDAIFWKFKCDSIYLKFMRCSTELEEAGIKFKRARGNSLFDIKFENGIMKIPRLEITGETESIFRNLVVYEQFSPNENFNGRPVISDYMKFMDCLINSERDVELLCRCNILHNCLGDDEVVAKMFNSIGDFVKLSRDNYYFSIFVEVNKHCAQRRHKWFAHLHYPNILTVHGHSFPSSLLFLLLLFTLAQTVYSVLAYYKK